MKTLQIILLLVIASHIGISQSIDKNYIVANQLQVPEMDGNVVNSLPVKSNLRTIQYFDGLGRPIQVIQKQQSPTKLDLIQPIEYDEFGRESIKYIPYTYANDGLFDQDYLEHQSDFYSNPPDGVAYTTAPYSTYSFDQSPFNKVKEEGFPGVTWQIGNNHTIKNRLLTNLGTEDIRLFKFDENGEASSSQFYPLNTLVKIETENENGYISTTYKDNLDRIILIEKNLSGEKVRTYYIYDALGLLRFVLTPKGDEKYAGQPIYLTNPIFLKKYCYVYKYDARKRIVEKQIPGQEPILMEYNSRDLMTRFEDGNLRQEGLKKYFEYDALNRVKEEGLTDNVKMDPTIFTFYDNYDFNKDGVEDFTYQNDPDFLENEPSLNNTGRITGKKVKIYDFRDESKGFAEYWQIIVYFYDIQGRIIQTITNTASLATDLVTNGLDFTGKVLKSKQKHQLFLQGSPLTTITKDFTYNHAGILQTVEQSINGNPYTVVYEHRFNELSQLSAKLLGKNTVGNPLQQINYKYNPRGWLTKINQLDLNATNQGDLFGMELLYEASSQGGTPDGQLDGGGTPSGTTQSPQYNGNISASRWQNYTITGKKGFELHYDGLDRLTAANYITSQSETWILDDTYDETGYSYDKNGNILSVNRRGYNASSSGGFIDRLQYFYDGNQLFLVNDEVTEPYGYDFCDYGVGDGFQPPPASDNREYFYDGNGNMIEDRNKGIVDIDYNELNLPRVIDLGNNNMIIYSYTAIGEKLKENLYFDGHLSSSTSYFNGFVYKDEQLEYIIGDEGRIVKTDSYGFVYEYSIKDHLGNVRVCFTDENSDGNLEITQENAYYAFGLEMDGLSYKNSQSAVSGNHYKYNQKEFQDVLNWYDYGARFYDPQLGRWHTVDPMCEVARRWSPYQYTYNNPIRYIDPDGMLIDDYSVDKKGNIKLEEIKPEDKTDHLYVKKDDGTLDKSKTIEVEKGVLDKGDKQTSEENNKGETRTRDTYEFKNDKTGQKLFEFLSENTNVEWNLLGFGTDNGDKGKNVLVTSHEESTVASGGIKSWLIDDRNEVIRYDYHNHPSGNSARSENDVDAWYVGYKTNPQAVFKIYTAQDKKYKQYYLRKK